MIIVHDCVTCKHKGSNGQVCACCQDFNNWQMAEPSGVLTTAKTKGGEMLTIDMLSVGDRVMRHNREIVTIRKINLITDYVNCYNFPLADNVLAFSRIPVTAQNFPADGVLWSAECRVFGSYMDYDAVSNGKYYLPLLKEKKAYLDSQKPEGNPFKVEDMVLWINDDSEIGTINRMEHYPDCCNLISMNVEDVCGDMLKVSVMLDQTGWYHYKRFYSAEPAEPEVSITLTGKVKRHPLRTNIFMIHSDIDDVWDELPFDILSPEDAAKVREALK